MPAILKRVGKRFKMVAISYSTVKEIERISDAYDKIKDKKFLSVSETAFLLSVGRATIYRYLHSKALKAVQIQGKTYHKTMSATITKVSLRRMGSELNEEE